MNTFRMSSHRIPYSPGSTKASGAIALFAGLLGIVVTAITQAMVDAGIPGDLEIDGVQELPATTAEAWSQWARLWWNATTEKLTIVPTLYPAGIAANAKVATTQTTAWVILNEGFFGSSLGTSAAHATGLAGQELVGIFVDPTTSIGARSTTIRVESLLACTDAFTAQGSGLYTGRFLAGVKTAKTFKGVAPAQGYLAGVQGKLAIAGTLGDGNSGGIYACAVLAQMDLTGGAFGADAQVYGLWVDNQAGGANGPTLSHMVNITNNGGNITNFFKLYGNDKVAVFIDIDAPGASVVIGTTSYGSNADGYLLAKVRGDSYKIPLIAV